jgi:hypothetical protein
MVIIKLLAWIIAIAGGKIILDRFGRKPDYRMEGTIIAGLTIPHAAWIFPHPFETWELATLNFWQLTTPFWSVWIFQGLSIWLFFELGLNYVQGRRGFKNGLGLLYYDHKEMDSGFIDKRFARIYFRVGHHRYHTAAKIAAAFLWILSTAAIIYNSAIY